MNSNKRCKLLLNYFNEQLVKFWKYKVLYFMCIQSEKMSQTLIINLKEVNFLGWICILKIYLNLMVEINVVFSTQGQNQVIV